jgi:hypothetical protein
MLTKHNSHTLHLHYFHSSFNSTSWSYFATIKPHWCYYMPSYIHIPFYISWQALSFPHLLQYTTNFLSLTLYLSCFQTNPKFFLLLNPIFKHAHTHTHTHIYIRIRSRTDVKHTLFIANKRFGIKIFHLQCWKHKIKTHINNFSTINLFMTKILNAQKF